MQVTQIWDGVGDVVHGGVGDGGDAVHALVDLAMPGIVDEKWNTLEHDGTLDCQPGDQCGEHQMPPAVAGTASSSRDAQLASAFISTD